MKTYEKIHITAVSNRIIEFQLLYLTPQGIEPWTQRLRVSCSTCTL